MAQIAILASDILNAGAYDGDPVSVVDDSHVFSAEEDKRRWLAEGGTDNDWDLLVPQIRIIIIPGMPVNIAKRLTQKRIRGAFPVERAYSAPDLPDKIVYLDIDGNETDPGVAVNRWRLGKQDRIPPNLANKLERDGFLEIPYDIPTLNNYIVDRQVIPDGLPSAGDEMDAFITNDPIRFYLDGQPVLAADL